MVPLKKESDLCRKESRRHPNEGLKTIFLIERENSDGEADVPERRSEDRLWLFEERDRRQRRRLRTCGETEEDLIG